MFNLFDLEERREKARRIYDILTREYGLRDFPAFEDPLRTLIMTVLSHRTKRDDEHATFDALWERYGAWAAMADAPEDELVKMLEHVTFPERKAPYIKAILARIYAERGEYSIEFLEDLPTSEALEWLLSLPGVGIKTATLVLLFFFHRPVMPVDTHVHRVSRRTGLIAPTMSAENAHQELLVLLGDDPYVLFNFHKSLLKHGRVTCFYYNPACERCPLKAICDYYAGKNTVSK